MVFSHVYIPLAQKTRANFSKLTRTSRKRGPFNNTGFEQHSCDEIDTKLCWFGPWLCCLGPLFFYEGRLLLSRYLSLCTHFSEDMKHAIRVRGLVYPNCAHSHLPHYFCSSYEYLLLCGYIGPSY
jgi:hypothetical protein